MYLTAETASRKWAFEIPPAPIDNSMISKTVEAELVVVGEGMAGLCTALSALEEGVKEGSIKKFVRDVEQITFAGQYTMPGQSVLYVTERCVFRLIDGKMTLVEIAPGIDLEKDILAQMGFTPEISKNLKAMDTEIFREHWGGLGKYISNPKEDAT